MRDALEQYNPWNREIDYGTDRLFHYQDIVSFLFRKEIQVLTGIRRCGKTTLLRQCMRYLLDRGIKKEQVIFIPCDDPLLKIKNFEDLHRILKGFQAKERLFVFLDEVQAVKGWEKYVKSVYDSGSNVKFIITGSTASFFEKDVASYLTGRHIFHKIKTLAYKEYLRLKPNGSLLDYAEWGGFPEVVKTDSAEQKNLILKNYLQTIILRDIIERNSLRNEKVVTSLLYALVSVVGGKINLSRLSRQFSLSRKTAEKYVRIGVDAFLLEEVGFFSHSRRKNIQKEYKIYPSDYGFCRMINGRFEKGRAMEWAVLHALSSPSYWSSNGHEVDFVSKNTGIQVCAGDKMPEREMDSLIAFRKIFPFRGLMLWNQTTDKTVSIEEFLLNPDVR
jgi:predicted AAA+ superfamily ATPase